MPEDVVFLICPEESTSAMHYSSLSRAGEKIMSLVKEFSGPQEWASVEEIYPFMDAMQKMFPQWVFMICPVHHPGSRYISNNCKQILGYTNEHLYSLFPSGIITHAHEQDQQDLKECLSWLHGHLKETSPGELASLRIITQFRVLHANGCYRLVQDEKASFSLQNSRIVYYSILKDITEETPFRGVRMDIFRQDAAQEKLAGFRPSSQLVRLSKRESELVALIRKGLRTKEIADHLRISHHTVRNIRQRMFEKFNVSSSIELLNKAV